MSIKYRRGGGREEGTCKLEWGKSRREDSEI